MASFTGEDFCGTWELRATDGAGGDLGFLLDWCLFNPPGDGDTGVPASSRNGIIALVGLFLLGSTYFMIRRRQTV